MSKALKRWRLDIIADLGGKEVISAQQETVIVRDESLQHREIWQDLTASAADNP